MNKKYYFFAFSIILSLIIGCKKEITEENSKTDSLAWFQKPMRIAAMQANFDNEDHIAVIDQWKEMGFNVEQLFHTIATEYSAVYDPVDDKQALVEYVKKAHEKGIKIILYLNIHFLDKKVEKMKEEWSQRKKDGSISMMYGTYYSVCLYSPWKDYFFTILDSLSQIDIDGIFLDGPVIANGGCYCDRCKIKYHEMFDGKSGTEKEKRWEFNAITRDKFLQDVYDYYKKKNPNKVMYMNLSVTHTHNQYIRLDHALKYNDIIGTEGGFMFYQPAKNAYLWRPSLTTKLIEAVAPDKPRVIFMAANHTPWSWWMHSPLETKLCISSVTANAANIWWGIHGTSKLFKTDATQAASEVLNFYKQNEKFLVNTKSDAKVALFYSFSTVNNEVIDFNEKSSNKASDQKDALHGYYSMLNEMQIPFDIVTDFKITLDKLSKYKVIVVPNTYEINQETENSIREFVKRGGLLITELATSLYDGKGKKKKEFGLSDVLGVSIVSNFKEHPNYNYFVFEKDVKFNKGITSPYIPLPLLSLKVKPNSDVKVLARALKDLSGRYVKLTKPDDAIITLNKFGKGKSLYFACDIGAMYNEYHVREYRIFVKNVIAEILDENITFENAPLHLEVVLRKQGERRLLHLIDYQTGPTRPFETVTIVNNMKIKVPKRWNVKKVTSQKLQRELDIAGSENSTEIVLPKLDVYDILVIE